MSRDGFQWVTVTVVEDHAAACRLLNPSARAQAAQVPGRTTRLDRGTGRHRKP